MALEAQHGLGAASLVELLVRQLRAEILSGTLAPGERLIEEQLTGRFGTSRAPLRAGAAAARRAGTRRAPPPPRRPRRRHCRRGTSTSSSASATPSSSSPCAHGAGTGPADADALARLRCRRRDDGGHVARRRRRPGRGPPGLPPRPRRARRAHAPAARLRVDPASAAALHGDEHAARGAGADARRGGAPAQAAPRCDHLRERRARVWTSSPTTAHAPSSTPELADPDAPVVDT